MPDTNRWQGVAVVPAHVPAPAVIVQASDLGYQHLGRFVEFRLNDHADSVRVEGRLRYLGMRRDKVSVTVAVFGAIDLHPTHRVTIREVA